MVTAEPPGDVAVELVDDGRAAAVPAGSGCAPASGAAGRLADGGRHAELLDILVPVGDPAEMRTVSSSSETAITLSPGPMRVSMGGLRRVRPSAVRRPMIAESS